MTRKEIECMYERLKDLKDMEKFIVNQKDDEKNQWLKVVSPHREYSFINGDIREYFIMFVERHIELLTTELNLESEK